MRRHKDPSVSVKTFRKIVGKDHAREARDEDAIDGVAPRFVVAPGSTQEASDIMTLANREGLAVAPRGSGTSLGLGNPPSRLDVIVETRRLNRVLEHAAGDLVVITQAGVTLRELQSTLAPAGQMLGLDPPDAGATVGGTIAANTAGPRRLRYGTMKDVLIGVTVILPDGAVAKSGGKVVKNVAGYDLGKLFTGSLGTLGLIVETIFRLHTRPSHRRIVRVDLADAEAAGRAVQLLLNSTLVASAIELRWAGGQGHAYVVFEGIEPSVEAQAAQAIALMRPLGAALVPAQLLPEDAAAAVWEGVHMRSWTSEEVGLKLNTTPAEVPALLRDVGALSMRHKVQARIAGHAAVSILLLALRGDEDDLIEMIGELRSRVERRSGTLVIVQAPPSLKRAVDIWGTVGDAFPVMQRVKEQFDPQRIMNPGRYVGGL